MRRLHLKFLLDFTLIDFSISTVIAYRVVSFCLLAQSKPGRAHQKDRATPNRASRGTSGGLLIPLASLHVYLPFWWTRRESNPRLERIHVSISNGQVNRCRIRRYRPTRFSMTTLTTILGASRLESNQRPPRLTSWYSTTELRELNQPPPCRNLRNCTLAVFSISLHFVGSRFNRSG